MTKFIIGEIFSSGGATLYKNPSDQTVKYTIISYHYRTLVQVLFEFELEVPKNEAGKAL